MKKLKSLDELYAHELRDLHSAERQITKALPKMAKAANSEELREAFEEHLEETGQQIDRLEKVIQKLGVKPTGLKCKGMEGLLEEGEEMLQAKDKGDPQVLDAALIGAAQRVEHYEIAAYGTVMALAKQLGRQDDLEVLRQTMEEEKSADRKLTQIAERQVNPTAA